MSPPEDWYLVRSREIGAGVICFPDLMAQLTLKDSNQSWPEVSFTKTRLTDFILAYCTVVNNSDDTDDKRREKYSYH